MEDASASVRVAGSDWLTGPFSNLVSEAVAAGGVDVELDLRGSLSGAKALAIGAADAAILVRIAEVDQLLATGFSRVAFAHAVGYVVVHASNPVEALDVGQLTRIFGDSGSAPIPRWEEFGFTSELAVRTVAPVIMIPDRLPFAGFISQRMLGGAALDPRVQRITDPVWILSATAADRGAIAVVPSPVLRSDLRVVAVAPKAGETAVAPTPKDLENGTYPVALAVELVFRSGGDAAVAPLAGLIASEQGARAIERSFLVPLSPDGRRRFRDQFAKRD